MSQLADDKSPESVISRYIDAMSAGDFAAGMAYFADDIVGVVPAVQIWPGSIAVGRKSSDTSTRSCPVRPATSGWFESTPSSGGITSH